MVDDTDPYFDTDSFVKGIGWAIAELVRLHDQPGMASDIMRESQYSLGDFISAGCDDVDLKILKKVWHD